MIIVRPSARPRIIAVPRTLMIARNPLCRATRDSARGFDRGAHRGRIPDSTPTRRHGREAKAPGPCARVRSRRARNVADKQRRLLEAWIVAGDTLRILLCLLARSSGELGARGLASRQGLKGLRLIPLGKWCVCIGRMSRYGLPAKSLTREDSTITFSAYPTVLIQAWRHYQIPS
jgi:hypothetical protein